MQDTPWNERFLASTRGQIVMALRRVEHTVDELARLLGLTDNAIRAHLTTLERDGLVLQHGSRRRERKPAVTYALTPAAEHLFPRPFDLVLQHVLDVFAERLSADDLERMVRDAGRRLVAGLPPLAGDLRTRAVAAAALLNRLGGLVEVEVRNSRTVLYGYHCPLASAMLQRPELCDLIESALTALIGAPVRQRCERGATRHCYLEVAA